MVNGHKFGFIPHSNGHKNSRNSHVLTLISIDLVTPHITQPHIICSTHGIFTKICPKDHPILQVNLPYTEHFFGNYTVRYDVDPFVGAAKSANRQIGRSPSLPRTALHAFDLERAIGHGDFPQARTELLDACAKGSEMGKM